jgi:tetratricopeptide (TPR) repeat protein
MRDRSQGFPAPCSAAARYRLCYVRGPEGIIVTLDGMPLAIELAAARVEALGVTQLLDRLDDRFALLAGGDRLAPGRHRSLAATVEWSYQLLEEGERRVFRQVSVFPGPFTLAAAETVAGADAGWAVPRLVDCSLLSPPRAGADGRIRYGMLETLRAYGAQRLAGAGEQDGALAALAGYALRVAEEAAAGVQTSSGEMAAARWLDAEDAAMRQVLAWAMGHDEAVVLRLAVALAPWWFLRGRAAAQSPLLREAAGHAVPGSDEWCAAQFWLGTTALYTSDLASALGHFAAVRDAVGDRGPSRPLADCLAGLSVTLSNLGRLGEAADDGRRALAVARELGYRAGEAFALMDLGIAACNADDLGSAVQLAQQAQQVPADIPGWRARAWATIVTSVLITAGDLDAAEHTCRAGLARCRDTGDLQNQASLLTCMADLDTQARRAGDAAAHLNEAVQIAARAGGTSDLLNALACCGYLCAATGRHADTVTVWAAEAALPRGVHGGPLRGAPPKRNAATGPAGARGGPGAGSRGTRRCDEPGHRHRVRPHADHPRPPAAGRGAAPGKAQRPGTGTGHPDRPGPHRCPDRRRPVHQHPDRTLPPGPHPGQDRLPPPRRPHPPGPHRRPGLAQLRRAAPPGPHHLWVVLPRAAARSAKG